MASPARVPSSAATLHTRHSINRACLPAALEGEATARAAAETQLVRERRALVAEAQQARVTGEAALREVQRAADAERRHLEAELDRAVGAAAQQAATAAAAHASDLQRTEVSQKAHRYGCYVLCFEVAFVRHMQTCFVPPPTCRVPAHLFPPGRACQPAA